MIHFQDKSVTLHHGDCLDVLRELADCSVDAVVTDPPYGLEFMGKAWDSFSDGTASSRATAGMSGTGYTDGARRLERPSFMGGTNPKCRTCDRWQRGANPCRCDAPDFPNERRARSAAFGEWCEPWVAECLRVLKPGGHMLAFGGSRTWHRLAAAVEDAGFEIRDSIAWLYGSGFPKSLNLVDEKGERTGWGTALKPAFEPVVVARKPLTGTVAANVLAHGTGALNIDGCRVYAKGASLGGGRVSSKSDGWDRPWKHDADAVAEAHARGAAAVAKAEALGRWPSNVVLDESQADALDEQSGTLTSGKMRAGTRPKGERETYGQDAAAGYETHRDTPGDSGGASRFFYVAKADASERPRVDGTAHPTVKPLALMRWLIRLVTPPGGTVLEPFAGSGTTVEACIVEGFECVAIEREADYLPLIEARISRRRDPVRAIELAGEDMGLFDLDGGAA